MFYSNVFRSERYFSKYQTFDYYNYAAVYFVSIA